MNSPEVFLGFGIFALILQAYRDIKTGKIDSRKNYIMQGLILGCIFVGNYNFWAYFAILLLSIGFGIFLGKNWGDGDKEIIRWVFPGLFLVGFTEMFVFMFALAACFTAFHIVARIILKAKGKLPAVPVILIAFVTATATYFLPWLIEMLSAL